jgi:hypothetical protein
MRIDSNASSPGAVAGKAPIPDTFTCEADEASSVVLALILPP